MARRSLDAGVRERLREQEQRETALINDLYEANNAVDKLVDRDDARRTKLVIAHDGYLAEEIRVHDERTAELTSQRELALEEFDAAAESEMDARQLDADYALIELVDTPGVGRDRAALLLGEDDFRAFNRTIKAARTNLVEHEDDDEDVDADPDVDTEPSTKTEKTVDGQPIAEPATETTMQSSDNDDRSVEVITLPVEQVTSAQTTVEQQQPGQPGW